MRKDLDLKGRVYNKYRRLYLQRLKKFRGATRLSGFLRNQAASSLQQAKGYDSIFDYKWDNLIIIDACRFDLYKEVIGDCERRISAGSCTPEFLSTNFSADFPNTVYISANPFLSPSYMQKFTGRKNPFHKVYRTYRHGWNDEESTTPPKAVTEDVLTAEKKFPTKKKIIHFMQPHHPFIESEIAKAGPRLPHADNKIENVWEKLEKGEVQFKDVWADYAHNLELVQEHFERLSKELSGRTVLTSDHGNLIGENGIYGHPCGLKATKIREVPLVCLSQGKQTETKAVLDDVEI